jgi:hypothetical protein
MPKLFLHIGLPKTATSSVQKFLFDNPGFLGSHGLRYARTGLHAGLKCHHDLLWALGLHQGVAFTDKGIRHRADEFLSGLARESREHADRDLVISSELFTFVDDFSRLEPLLAAFPDRDVRFVLTLRRQDYLLESLYQQIVKDGLDRTFENWLGWSRHRADYRVLIERLLVVAEPGQLILRAFREVFPEGGPVEDFLDALGLAPSAVAAAKIDKGFENPRMSRETIEIIRRANELGLELNYFLGRRLKRYSHAKAEFLEPAERRELLASFDDANRELASMVRLPAAVHDLLFALDDSATADPMPGGPEAEIEILLRLVAELRDEQAHADGGD